MFKYPTLTTTTFNGQRWYVTPEGKAYPSVTSVLGGTMSAEKEQSLNNWRKSLGETKANQVSKNATDNGTVLHALIERYLKKEELFAPIPGYQIQPQNKSALNAIKNKLDKIEEIWCIEEAMYSNILELAGRVDCVGVYKKRPRIIDFKTSGKIKNDKDIEDYKYQLAAYAIMHNELFGTEITDGTILMVADSGFPLEFNIDLLPFFEPLYERVQLFYNQLNQKLKIA